MAGATVVPTRCDLDGDRRPRRRLSVIQRPGRGVGDVGIGPQTAADGPQDGAELHVVAAALRHRGDPVAGAGRLPAASGASTGGRFDILDLRSDGRSSSTGKAARSRSGYRNSREAMDMRKKCRGSVTK